MRPGGNRPPDHPAMRAISSMTLPATRLQRLSGKGKSGYVVMGWLLLIAVTLVAGGHYFDVAVRDVIMALGAFTLARLSEVRAGALAPSVAPLSARTSEQAG